MADQGTIVPENQDVPAWIVPLQNQGEKKKKNASYRNILDQEEFLN